MALYYISEYLFKDLDLDIQISFTTFKILPVFQFLKQNFLSLSQTVFFFNIKLPFHES